MDSVTKRFRGYTPETLNQIYFQMAIRDDTVTCLAISYFQKFQDKEVIVVKGRKVPKGTKGTCFYIGSTCYGKYGDPWGIYTKFRVGIRDSEGTVYWTSIDNIEVCKEETT